MNNEKLTCRAAGGSCNCSNSDAITCPVPDSPTSASVPVASIDTPDFRLVVKPEVIGLIRFQQAVAHIDDHAAQSYEAGQRDKDGNHVDDLRAWLDESRDDREQIGNAFHLTSLKLQEAEASLARMVKALEDIASACNCCSDRAELAEIAADALALLPAKAEATHGTFPERDANVPAEQQGIFNKFQVTRTDGSSAPGGKHHGCEYFVLDLTHDTFAPPAMRAYAVACRATHAALADDIEMIFAATPATAMGEELPPLPGSCDGVALFWTEPESKAIRDYGRACMALSPPATEWRDKLRWSKANTDYHGYIAFTPGQLEHFVSMLIGDWKPGQPATAPASQPAAPDLQVAIDPVVEANRALLLQRSQIGLVKYGGPLASSGLSRAQLLRHLLEELLDGANYAQAELMRDAALAAQQKNGARPAPTDPAPCEICDGTRVTFGKRCACAGAEVGGPP